MRPKVIAGGALALFFLVVFLPEFASPLLALVITLAIGWYFSAIRLFEGWHSHEGVAVLFGLALAVLVVGSHFCLLWIYASLRTKQRDSTFRWRWKWTLCGYAILGCALAAMGSVMLTTHQLYWLSKSSDPMFIEPEHVYVERFHDVSLLKEKAEAVQWNSDKTRASYLGMDSINSNKLYDVFQPVWIEKNEQTLAAVVLIPRHPLSSSTAKVVIVQPGTNALRPLSELNEVLASFGIVNTNAGQKGIASTP